MKHLHFIFVLTLMVKGWMLVECRGADKSSSLSSTFYCLLVLYCAYTDYSILYTGPVLYLYCLLYTGPVLYLYCSGIMVLVLYCPYFHSAI